MVCWTSMVFGIVAGSVSDAVGFKNGVVLAAILYGAAAFSVTFTDPILVAAGRIASGIGSTLLFTAPEGWLVSEVRSRKLGDAFLSKMFGAVWFMNSMNGVFAGYFAAERTKERFGIDGVFKLAGAALFSGGVLCMLLWNENSSKDKENDQKAAPSKKPSVPVVTAEVNGSTLRGALTIIATKEDVVLVGLIQSFAEAALYTFILAFSPALDECVTNLPEGTPDVPKGKVFACFMVSVMIGASLYDAGSNLGATNEMAMAVALFLSVGSLGTSAVAWKSLGLLEQLVCFMVFEAAVGIYFPAMGSLRSKAIPESGTGIITNLFRIPLNLFTAITYSSYDSVGTNGLVYCAAGLLGLAAVLHARLMSINPGKAKAE